MVSGQVFIPRKLEDAFARRHSLVIRRLPNGVIIVGGARETVDSVDGSIHFGFRAGSYFDPLGREGVHHLLEHLVSHQPSQ